MYDVLLNFRSAEMAGNLIIAQNSLGFLIGSHNGCSLGSPLVVVDEQQFTNKIF
jgi:hypothetical protein